MPLIETFFDTFSGGTLDPQWTAFGAGVVSGQLHLNAHTTGGAAAFSAARSPATYTWIGSALVVEVIGVPVGDAFAQVWVRDPTPADTVDRLGFEIVGSAGRLDFIGQTTATYVPIGTTASLTFDPVAHRWLKIAHTGTSVVWSTSPNGTTWTVRRTLATPPVWTGNSDLQISIEAYRTAGTNDTFAVDNVNFPPGTVLPEITSGFGAEPFGLSPFGGIDYAGAYADAIDADVRRPVVHLRADWLRNNYDHDLCNLDDVIDEVTIDRATVSQLPPEVGLVEGYNTAELTARLSGSWPSTDQTPLEVLSPFQENSPLYRVPTVLAPVTCDTGFVTATGEQTTRQFTGQVRSTAVSSVDRKVQLSALDPANRLRATITLKAVAMYLDLLNTHGHETYRERFNSQWLIDYVLRRNGIFASPPARDNAVLSVTGHGALIPEVGEGGAPESFSDTFRFENWIGDVDGNVHPFGMLAPYAGGNYQPRTAWSTSVPLSMAAGTGIGLSFWAYTGPGRLTFDKYTSMLVMGFARDASATLALQLEANGFLGVYGHSPDGDWTVIGPSPTTVGWRFYGVHVSFEQSQWRVYYRMDGVTLTGTFTIPVRQVDYAAQTQITYIPFAPVTNLQIWSSPVAPPAGPWQGEVWQSQADLDRGINQFIGIPEVSGEDSWPLLQEIAGAEFGTLGFDETGRFFFRNRDTTRENTTVTETVTADRNLAELSAEADEAAVRNEISVKSSPIYITDWEPVFEAKTFYDFDTPGFTTSHFSITLPENIYTVELGRYARFDSNGEWQNESELPQYRDVIQYSACFATDPQTPAVLVRVGATRVDSRNIVLTVSNPYADKIHLASPATFEGGEFRMGDAALRIPGRLVQPREEVVNTVTDDGSIAMFGRATWPLPDNPWRQYWANSVGIGEGLLAQLSYPRPVLDDFSVPHDPRRKLGNRIRVLDPDGMGSTIATIVAIATTISSGGAVDRITARPVGPPGIGLLGDSELGLLDDTMILAP